MRPIIAGFAGALIMLAAGAAPAAACGGYGCAPCAVAVPCGAGVVYSGYGYDYIDYERLPTIAVPRWYATPQYYYVDQGPTYTGPGAFAPLPSYQQRAVRSRYGYRHSHDAGYRDYGYRHSYRGGPYANAMHHFYAGAPAWHGPAIVSYRPGARRVRHAHRHRATPQRHHHQHRRGDHRRHR